MKIKKILKGLGITLLLVLFLGAAYIHFSLPKLPEGANAKINKAVASEIAPLKGKEGFAYNGDTKIWYESISPKDSIKGSILLIMGISNDALAWPEYFLDPLVEEGYQLVRFDNRGTGLSDWVEDWSQDNAYSLEDIAADAIAVMDELDLETTNVIGVSLGGMIAQTLAIEYPERVQSLISMMSSGNIMDKALPSINTTLIKDLILAQLKYGLIKSEKNEIKLNVLARMLLQGEKEHELNIEDISRSVLYNLRKRRGYNHNVFKQHTAATMKSGSRYEALQQLTLPSLIIHGTKDPMINFLHGKKCQELIPGADYLWLEGMGHDIPEIFVGKVLDKIINHLEISTEY